MFDEYTPFEGICLTDTFQMYEKDDLVDELLEDNSARRKRQKELDIRVIVGNPPYSVGQGDANANNANVRYPHLDDRIRDTYGARSEATNKNSLYDSYIRSIRWASDRIGDAGVIGFVTNAGFVEGSTADGLRKCLVGEFSSLFVFHLRGNARTSGESRRKEKDNVFGVGSRAPVAISLLVKNPSANEHGRIYFQDIGDYLSREEKLEKIAAFASISGIEPWQSIVPDEHGDWLKQRDDSFSDFILLGAKTGKNRETLFENYSRGLETGRDAWVFNSSDTLLKSNVASMVDFYNKEVERFILSTPEMDSKSRALAVTDFINTDATKISWTRGLRGDCAKGKYARFSETGFITCLYRPFTKQRGYFDRMLNAYVNQLPRMFPDATSENLVIGVSSSGEKVPFSVLISNQVPSLHCMDIEGSQCFPLYLFGDAAQASDDDLFAEQAEVGLRRRDAITDAGLAHFQAAYPSEEISKEDLFYYVYGILHSQDYRERFADNLSKELPRIPAVKQSADFWAFSKAGRALAELHLNYETVEPYPLTIEAKGKLTDADYRVEKMKFAKKKDPETGKSVSDRSTVIYNGKISLKDIPEAAWDYVVNGKAALDWVMERQAVRTDKASGIVNDANDWAIETMGNPKYPLELFQRVVTVSLETQKIVNNLPPLDI